MNFPINYEFWDQPVKTLISLVNKCSIMQYSRINLCWICSLKFILRKQEELHVPEVHRKRTSTWPKIAGLGSENTGYSKCSISVIPNEYAEDALAHWYQDFSKVYVLGLHSVQHIAQLHSSVSHVRLLLFVCLFGFGFVCLFVCLFKLPVSAWN